MYETFSQAIPNLDLSSTDICAAGGSQAGGSQAGWWILVSHASLTPNFS